MKRIIFMLSLLLFFTATPAMAALNVVATLPRIGSVARDIGGGRVEVKVLVRPSLDPHFIQPKPSMLLAVRRADILIYNGLGLEAGYLPILIESSRNRAIATGRAGNIDASRFLDIAEIIGAGALVDRSMGDVHSEGNPHYHFSPGNVLRVAGGLAAAFAVADPENAAFFKDNLEAFKAKMVEKRKEWSGASLKGNNFIAFHKLFEYLARDFSFEIIGYIEPRPGVPPSSGYIQRLVGLTKDNHVAAILTASYYGRRQARWLARETGTNIIDLPHDVGAGLTNTDEDWFEFMDRVIRAIRAIRPLSSLGR